jgi:hypothetical protein|tara:strand:- start:9063 stop:9593 length:531 start_codon:yes stop_codon:yes gene_type:complete
MSKYQFKTTNIKGKQYVEVNERIKYFRLAEDYKGWSLSTEMINLDESSCVIRATICNADGMVIATGFAQEDKSSSFINKTSYVENCETSAWGRALANLGIGIDTSIASSNEVVIAIAKQNSTPNTKATKTTALKEMTEDIKDNMIKAVKDGKKDAVETALSKYVVTDKVKAEILSV